MVNGYRFRGFTLIELIIVIVLIGIVAVMVSQILSRPFMAYRDTSERAELVTMATNAINHMAEELRTAVPNTIRVADDQVLEFVPIRYAGRYRDGNPGDKNALSVNIPDKEFNNLGNIDDSSGYRLVIYNTGVSGFYNRINGGSPANRGPVTAPDNTVTIEDCDTATCGDTVTVDHITLSKSHRFDSVGSGSPSHRFYLFNYGVVYHCNPNTGTNNIMRYEDYDFTTSQVTSRSTLSASATRTAPLLEHVTACSFSFDPGNSSYRSATVQIQITLQDDRNTVQLAREVHIWNVP